MRKIFFLDRKGLTAFILSLVAIAFIGFSAYLFSVNASVVFEELTFEETYEINSKLSLPSGFFTADGQRHEAKNATITYPSGEKKKASTFILDEAGLYTVEYRADIDGKVHKKNYTFKVMQRSYDFENAVYDTEKGCLSVIFDASNKAITFSQPIDLSGLTEETLFLSVDVHPFDAKNISCSNFIVTLTDVYDSENVVRIIMNMHNAYRSYGVVYHQAAYGEQPYKGVEDGVYGGKLWTNSGYGTACVQDKCQYYLNYEEKTAYAGLCVYKGYGKGLICDFDDQSFFDEPWKGFVDGTAYLTIEVGGIASSEVRVDLIYVYGMDLSKNEYVISEGTPRIAVNTESYDEKILPPAVCGEKYKAFDAVAYNGRYAKNITPVVYYAYGTKSEVNLDVDSDGYFKTDYVGEYTMVYETVSPFGNKFTKTVSVHCKKTADALAVNFADSLPTEIYTGEEIALPETVALNGIGESSVKVDALLNGLIVDLEKDKDGNYVYTPNAGGKLKITLTAIDFICRTITREYEITVVARDTDIVKPVTMPKYAFDGYAFELPSTTAYNYAMGKNVSVEIWVTDASGERKLTNNLYTPSVNNSMDKIRVEYKTAKSTLAYDIPVIKAGEGLSTTLDMSAFFVEKDAMKTATAEGIRFATQQNGATIEFANKLLADGFSFSLNVDENNNGFDRFDVYLTDSVNDMQTVKLTFAKNKDASILYVNDSERGTLVSFSFTGKSTSSFAINFSNFQKTVDVDGKTVSILTDMEGNAFNGFESEYVYCLFAFGNVKGSSAIEMLKIGGQVLGNAREEFIKPSVYLSSYGGVYKAGDEYELCKIYAGDTLSTYVTVKYTFTAPDGNPVTAKDGTSIEDVDGKTAYTVVLSQKGEYKFNLKATDQNGNVYNKSYKVVVRDSVAPTINANLTDTEIEQNKSLKVSDVEFLDDSGTVNGYIYIIRPDAIIEMVTEKEYKFTLKGTYKVCYYALDETYNSTTVIVSVNVK